jgi:hypothetical protein
VITYTVADGNGGADTSTLSLSMVAVNDPPVDLAPPPLNEPSNHLGEIKIPLHKPPTGELGPWIMNASRDYARETMPDIERSGRDYAPHGRVGGVSRSAISDSINMGELLVEAVLHEHTIYVQMADLLVKDRSSEVVHWLVEPRGEAALFAVESDGTNLAIINRLVGVPRIVLNIRGLTKNGAVVTGDFAIDMNTGEVTSMNAVHLRSQTFHEQLEAQSHKYEVQSRRVIDALAQ